MKPRPVLVVVHRWAGLTIARFLLVAALTGSLLAFGDALELLAAPRLHRVAPPFPGAPLLDPQELRRAVLQRYPGSAVDYLPLRFEPGRTVTGRGGRDRDYGMAT